MFKNNIVSIWKMLSLKLNKCLVVDNKYNLNIQENNYL